MLLLTFAYAFLYLLRLTAFPLAAPTLVKVLNAPSPDVPRLVRIHSVNNSALHVLGSFSANKTLIFLAFLPNLFVEFMVGVQERMPDALDHLFILLSVFHVLAVPQFQLLNLLVLVIFLHLQIHVS